MFKSFETPKNQEPDLNNNAFKNEFSSENLNNFDDDAKSLIEKEEVIVNLQNLDESDLIKIKEMMTLKDDIIGTSFAISEKFRSRLEDFFSEISGAYSEEELRKTALVNVLKGEDISEDVEHLDLEGEYSAQEFLQGLVNELEEGIL